ncbi:MAG: hypothetical protein AB9915_02905 [Candidatus Dojkabacteria bacterium]
MNAKVYLLRSSINIELSGCGFKMNSQNKVWAETIAVIIVYSDFDHPTALRLWNAAVEAIPDKEGGHIQALEVSHSFNRIWNTFQNSK